MEFFTAHILHIPVSVTGGNAEGQLVSFHPGHSILHFLIDSLTSPAVISFLKALQRNGRNEILNPEHLMTKFLVNERTIGKRQELTVRVHLAQFNNVFFPHQRFTACVDVHIGTQLLALTDNGVDIFQTEV